MVDLDDSPVEPAEGLPGLNAQRRTARDADAWAEEGEIVALTEIAVEPRQADDQPVHDDREHEDALVQPAQADLTAVAEAVLLDATPVDPVEDQDQDQPAEAAADLSADREPEMADADADRPKRRGWWSGNR